jgi:hypothetical protein
MTGQFLRHLTDKETAEQGKGNKGAKKRDKEK